MAPPGFCNPPHFPILSFPYLADKGSPGRNCTDGFLVDGDQLVQHSHSCGEDPVRMQEGVEKVNAEEPQVCQSFQETPHTGIADLEDLAGVHGLAEPNVNVVTVQAGV